MSTPSGELECQRPWWSPVICHFAASNINQDTRLSTCANRSRITPQALQDRASGCSAILKSPPCYPLVRLWREHTHTRTAPCARRNPDTPALLGHMVSFCGGRPLSRAGCSTNPACTPRQLIAAIAQAQGFIVRDQARLLHSR